MKVLYLSDNYTYDNYGTKRSIFEAVRDRGWDMQWIDKSQTAALPTLVAHHKPDQVWLAHSNLTIGQEVRDSLGIPVIGFGFSDPYYFSIDRFKSYHAYVTNHVKTMFEHGDKIPMCYNPTACDFKYHRVLDIEKDIDISVIGLGNHPRFVEKDSRIRIVEKLREMGHKVVTFGKGWPQHPMNFGHVTGQKFLEAINRSHLGLDIQDSDSPLAHRMFEYAGCGVPVITRFRTEVINLFASNMEILTYMNEKNLLHQVDYYMARKEELHGIGGRALARCKKAHDITHRVTKIIDFVSNFRKP